MKNVDYTAEMARTQMAEAIEQKEIRLNAMHDEVMEKIKNAAKSGCSGCRIYEIGKGTIEGLLESGYQIDEMEGSYRISWVIEE